MMSKKQFYIYGIATVLLCIPAFFVGRFSQRLSSATAGASYRAIILQGVLVQIRSGETDRAVQSLDMRLDEDIATLAEIRKYSAVVQKLFISSRLSRQADTALSRFIYYRTNVATDYTGVPLLKETGSVKFEGCEQVNQNRTRINELVKEVLQDNLTKE